MLFIILACFLCLCLRLHHPPQNEQKNVEDDADNQDGNKKKDEKKKDEDSQTMVKNMGEDVSECPLYHRCCSSAAGHCDWVNAHCTLVAV